MIDCETIGKDLLLHRGQDNIDKSKFHQNSLVMFDLFSRERKFDNLCVNVPLEYSTLDRYKGTLGHKANHGPVAPNALYTYFSSHPVLGSTMALFALGNGNDIVWNNFSHI